MKTSDGKYTLSIQMDLTPEQIVGILSQQLEVVDDEIGSHEVIFALRQFALENLVNLVNRVTKLNDDHYPKEKQELLTLIAPLLKERKKND
jgi:hypothetical protein